MRHIQILSLIIILTACAPAQRAATVTPIPPTVTLTAAPTSTSTLEPTNTPTPEPTQTSTLELSPTATAEVIPLPEGFATMEEAAKLGWVYADENGDGRKELVQHMVVENSEIVFDKAKLNFLGQEEHLKGFTYTVHLIDGEQFFPKFSSSVEEPKPGFKWEWFHYEVDGISGNDVKHFLNLAPGYCKNPVTFETTDRSKLYDSEDGVDEFIKSAFYSTPGNPKGFLSIGLQVPVDETILSIQLATRPGQPKYTIFESGKMDSVTAN